MLVLLDGWACRYKTLEDGRRQILSLFLPGDMCDLNVFVLESTDHAIGAISTVTLGEIDRGAFAEIMTISERVTQALWWEMLVAFSIQRMWTVNLGQRSATERMAHLLCEIYYRLQSVGLSRGNECDFPMTQIELGDALGLSSVHVNRTLQELRNSDLVALRERTLTIPDLAALERLAFFSPDYLHLRHEGRHLDANE